MNNPIAFIMNALYEQILAAAKALQAEGALPEGELAPFDVEIPKDTKNGDFSTNFAMKHARVFRLNPRAIGEFFTIIARVELEEFAGNGADGSAESCT